MLLRIDTVYPPVEAAMAARSQAESMAAAEFAISGGDADLQLHNLDLLSLVQARASRTVPIIPYSLDIVPLWPTR